MVEVPRRQVAAADHFGGVPGKAAATNDTLVVRKPAPHGPGDVSAGSLKREEASDVAALGDERIAEDAEIARVDEVARLGVAPVVDPDTSAEVRLKRFDETEGHDANGRRVKARPDERARGPCTPMILRHWCVCLTLPRRWQ